MLRGYRSVTVFNTEVTEYYIKNGDNFELLVVNESKGEDLFNKFFNTINGDAENKIPGQKVYVRTGSGDEDRIVRITSLEEYFHYLPDLLSVDEFGNKIPTKFAILPLDEPHFIINANTRAINIPSEFKTNGVAVQGDDLAEIIYFEVDRFFDAMDLNNCNILIQWETPKGAKAAVRGVSKEYVRDIESKPGKLIFGWALEKVITQNPGNLKLSVKFYETDEFTDESGKTTTVMVYNLNTLTSTVTIRPGLDLDLSQEGSYVVTGDAASDLLERLEHSIIIGNAEAAPPIFLDFPFGEEEPNVDSSYDVGADGTLSVFALARSTDTGVVSYDWRKRELNLDNQPTGTIKTVKYDSEFDYVPVTIAELKADANAKHRIVYTKLDGTYGNAVSGDVIANDTTGSYEDKELAEYKATFSVDSPGIYSVRAKNRIANSITSVSSTDFGADKVVVFKRPEDVIMITEGQTSDQHFIDGVTNVLAPRFEDAIGTCTYKWFKASEVDGKPVVNNKPLASATATLTGLPVDSRISYGENIIRIAVPDYFEAEHQNVGAGGNAEKFYATFKAKAPENAVYFLEKQIILSSGEEIVDSEPIKLADKGSTTHRTCWFSIAQFDPQIGKFEYFGRNRSIEDCDGRIETLEWYDENKNLISIDEYTVQYVSKDNYEPFYKYNEVSGATEATYTVETPGIYHLEVTRTRNNSSKSGISMDYRVTNEPVQPVLAETAQIEKYLSEVLAGNYKFEIKLESQDADSYLVQIMRQHVKDNADVDFVVSDTVKSGLKNTITIDPTTFIDKINAHNVEFNENLGLDGKYYAIITTVLNGKDSAPLTTEGVLDWTIVED